MSEASDSATIARLKSQQSLADLESVSERLLEAAIREGSLKNVPGKGKPLQFLARNEEYDPDWLLQRLVKEAGYVPLEVQNRLLIEKLLAKLPLCASETAARTLLETVNAEVRRLNTMGLNRLENRLAPVDVEAKLAEWRARHSHPAKEE
jgi:hypothetical protein